VASVHYLCTKCERRLSRDAGEGARPCEHCGAESTVLAPRADALIERCAACGHDELYVQKDFNRTTGIALVVLGAVLVPWSYVPLIAITVLDYVIWRVVKNVIVCYRCQAVHRGYGENPSIKPFDLATHDRHVYGAAPPGAEEH
jgi:hypothetical protein